MCWSTKDPQKRFVGSDAEKCGEVKDRNAKDRFHLGSKRNRRRSEPNTKARRSLHRARTVLLSGGRVDSKSQKGRNSGLWGAVFQSTMSDHDDDEDGDDLYDDINLQKASSTTRSSEHAKPSGARRTNSSHHHHPKSLTDQVQELQETVQRLQRENVTLQRNMGTLFRTATAELARKDRQLQELQKQLQQQQQQEQHNE